MKTLPLSRSCYCYICQLCCIRPYLDFKTANIIAKFIAHSKLDYCNSLYFNLPTDFSTFNSLTHSLANTPKYSHITCS